MRPPARLTSSSHRHLGALFLLWPLLASTPARAEDIASAEALFNSGLADMQAGRYETGCKALAESQRLDPRGGTLFTLATCEARWGHIATAVTRFGDYLALYERLPDDRKAAQAERHKVATEMRDKLLPEVPRLTLSLPDGAPPGTVVKRDGEVVAAASLGRSLPVDPGEHTLSTQAPGGAPWEQRISIGKGEKKQVTLEVLAAVATPPAPSAPATAPPAAAASPGPGARRVATYVLGSTGLAGLIAGGVLGGLATGQKGIVDQHCGSAIGSNDATACDPTGLAAANAAKGLGWGSTIGLAAGGAVLATALVLLVTEPAAAKPLTGKAKSGPWISAGVLSAGPAGAELGVNGAF